MVDPTARRPRRKPGENRALLITAGIHQFAEYGYRAASTALIAEQAGVPQPHVYANFSGKVELFHACAEVVVDALISDANGGEGSGALRERTRELYARFFLQLITARRDPQLEPLVSKLIEAARARVDPEALRQLLEDAALSMLSRG